MSENKPYASGGEQMMDISNCRIRRNDAGIAVCMIAGRQCPWELRIGHAMRKMVKYCKHPLVEQIPESAMRPAR